MASRRSSRSPWPSRARARSGPAARGPARRAPPPRRRDLTDEVKTAAEQLVAQVGRVVVGKAEAVEQLFAALLVEGHVLLDDVPGVGKTTLARAVARSF